MSEHSLLWLFKDASSSGERLLASHEKVTKRLSFDKSLRIG